MCMCLGGLFAQTKITDTINSKLEDKLLNVEATCTPCKVDTCCCKEEKSVCCDGSTNFIEPKTVIYDFKTKKIAWPEGYNRLRRGDAVRIKVLHFNPFLYQVNINGRDSTHYALSDGSNLLSAFTSLSNLSSIVAGIANSITTPGPTVAKGADLSSVVPLALTLMSAQATGNTTPPSNDAHIDLGRQHELDALFSHYQKSIKVSAEGLELLKDSINLAAYYWARKFKSQRDPSPTCEEFSAMTSGTLIDTFERNFFNLKESFLNRSKNIKSEQEDYLNKTAKYADIIRAKDGLTDKVTDSLIKAYYFQSVNDLSKIDSVLSYRNLQGFVETIDKIRGLKPCFTSAPIFLLDDSKIISLQIKPWKDSASGLISDIPIVFELPWTQNRIWGISAGIYVSSLHNKNYTNQHTSPTDTSYRLINDNSGNIEFGINALAYAAWKLHPGKDNEYTYLGAIFGAGMSIESKPKPRIFLGGNFIEGRNSRLMFAMGLNIGYVDRLSSAYSQDVKYTIAQTGFIKEELQIGGFLSINYSFLSK